MRNRLADVATCRATYRPRKNDRAVCAKSSSVLGGHGSSEQLCAPLCSARLVFLNDRLNVQPFSQKSRTRTVAKEFQIGLCGVVEADSAVCSNGWKAGFLGERL